MLRFGLQPCPPRNRPLPWHCWVSQRQWSLRSSFLGWIFLGKPTKYIYIYIHTPKTNREIPSWKRRNDYKSSICRFHVSFFGCTEKPRLIFGSNVGCFWRRMFLLVEQSTHKQIKRMNPQVPNQINVEVEHQQQESVECWRENLRWFPWCEKYPASESIMLCWQMFSEVLGVGAKSQEMSGFSLLKNAWIIMADICRMP